MAPTLFLHMFSFIFSACRFDFFFLFDFLRGTKVERGKRFFFFFNFSSDFGWENVLESV